MGLLDVVPNPFKSYGEELRDFFPYQSDEGKAVLSPSQAEAKKRFEVLGQAQAQAASRPIGGIEIKPNTHAVVQVIDHNGKPVSVFNKLGTPVDPLYGGSYTDRTLSGSNWHTEDPENVIGIFGWGDKSPVAKSMGYDKGVDPNGNPASLSWTDWILQTVREERTEKTQLVETFGDNYLYSYGQKPRVLSFSGMLMNTADMQWKAIFWENWDKYFRASKLQELHARMYISFDETIVEGYPITAMAQQSSESPYAILFQFNFFVTNYISSAINRSKVSGNVNRRSVWQVRAGYDFQNTKWAKHAFMGVDSITDVLRGRGIGNYVGSLARNWMPNPNGNPYGILLTNFVDKTLRQLTTAGVSALNASAYHSSRSIDQARRWEMVGANILKDSFVMVGDMAQQLLSESTNGMVRINDLLGYAGTLMGQQHDRSEGWGNNSGYALTKGATTGSMANVFKMGYEQVANVMVQEMMSEDEEPAGLTETQKNFKSAVEASVAIAIAAAPPPPDSEED